MAGYAVSGFVDGFFKGRDWRDSKEDRKLDRERQKKLDQMVEEKHGIYKDKASRDAVFDDKRLNEIDYQMSERERKAAEAAQEREFMRRMAGELGAVGPNSAGGPQVDPSQYPIGVPEGQQTQQAAPVGTPIPAQPRLGYGAIAPDVAGTGNNIPPSAGVPQQQNEIITGGGATDQLAGGLLIQPAGIAEDRLQDGPRRTQQVREVDPNASGFRQDVDAVQRNREILSGLSRITTKMATEGASPIGRTFGAVRDYFSETPGTAEEKAAQRAATAEAQKWFQSDDAVQYFSANPARLEQAAQDPVGFYQSGMTQQQPDPAAAPAADPNQPSAVQGAPTDQVSPQVKQAEDTASQPVQQQEAAAGVKTAERVALSFGLKPGENATQKQIDRGSQAYVDRYYETVAPQMVQFYMGRGEMDKAQAYIDLIESRQGRDALKDIGKATFSVVNGDYDSAGQHMLSAFKRYGYADPSMDLDEEATGIVKDENGQAIGGRVVFVDKKSGNRFEKTFATPDEFIQYAHLMTSPSTVAELLMKPKETPKGAISQKDIVDAANEVQKQNVGMTYDQALQEVMTGLGRLGMSAGGQAPQQEPPLYRMGQ